MTYGILNGSDDFSLLSNKIGKFKVTLCEKYNLTFNWDDFRIITLDSIQQILLSLTGYIRGFMWAQKKINDTNEFIKILGLGLSPEKIEKVIYKFPIESLVTMIHFQIDSYFGQVCKTILNDAKDTFYKRMIKVLENIPYNKKHQNTLQCLANIRNSFHNNGIHTINPKKRKNWDEPLTGKLDRTFKSKNIKIEFRHNKVIMYNDREALYLLIESSVSTLQKVINYHSI